MADDATKKKHWPPELLGQLFDDGIEGGTRRQRVSLVATLARVPFADICDLMGRLKFHVVDGDRACH
jgi:hypothetical protein